MSHRREVHDPALAQTVHGVVSSWASLQSPSFPFIWRFLVSLALLAVAIAISS